MNRREHDIKLSPTLIEWLGTGRCTLVAGPLISLAPSDHLGPPSPARLALELAEHMGRPPDNYELPWVAQLYVDREGEFALRRFVAERLSYVRYRPTLLHYLVVQLPFARIIYTAQDNLLRRAHESRNLPATYIQPGGSLSYATGRLVVNLFGNAEDENSLKITEDERRKVFVTGTVLSEALHTFAQQDSLLFLGYTVNDPDLMDLYYLLRPEKPGKTPRAFLVGPGYSTDYEKYWEQHNATLYDLDTLTFVQKLVETLDLQVDLTYEYPPVLDAKEREARDKIKRRFVFLSRLNVSAESGAELRRFPPHLVIQMQAELGSLETETEAGKGDAQRQLQLGNIEWSLGNLELASEHFKSAIQLEPQLLDAHMSLHYLLVEKGDLEEALQVYQQVLQYASRQTLLPERYEIRKILGQIDLGVSYCVYDLNQEQTFTATILRRAFTVQEEALAQFDRQMSALTSPHISRYYGFDRYRGRTYMLSEYVEGTLLSQRLAVGDPLAYFEAMQIARQVAIALDDGHSQGVPHLDLNPANIVLCPDGPKLVNYGYSHLARMARLSERLPTREHSDYLSPEQLAGKEGDRRSDVYALGTILYQMLTGYTPGVGKLEHASETVLEVTEAVDVLIDHARERYPMKRFASAGEVDAEINRIILISMGRDPNQYIRAGLAYVSRLFERIAMGKSLFILLPVLAVTLAASLILGMPSGISLAARILFPLLSFSILVSVPIDLVVRGIARWRGLGSLITGGRGMGAIMGLVFTLDLISVMGNDNILRLTTQYNFCMCVDTACSACELTIIEASPFEVLGFFATVLALVLFFTGVSMGIILLAGLVAESRWRHFTRGFYWSFVVIIIFWLLMAIFHQPAGLIS